MPSGPMIAKKMRPGNTKNGRNLCAHRWLKQTNPSGSSAEFKTYWDCLSAEQISKYGAECAQLIADGMWTHCNAANIARHSARTSQTVLSIQTIENRSCSSPSIP
ncbi:hypothetical protein C8R48DRAFT_777877 [Suillus tomentosus]|nr:hypothetical protein C8R48DRAFT_777877 [Suillus tomentosus]